MRVRPKDKGNIAFYAPAADITQGMRGVLSSAFKIFKDMNEGENKDHDAARQMSRDLAYFMKSAVLSDKTWADDGLPQLEFLFNRMHPMDASEFLYKFFICMMDFYWHSMRLTTDAPEINPAKMEEAVQLSLVLRTMPKELRDAYLDHLNTYNILPPVFKEGALFNYGKVDKDDN